MFRSRKKTHEGFSKKLLELFDPQPSSKPNITEFSERSKCRNMAQILKVKGLELKLQIPDERKNDPEFMKGFLKLFKRL